MVRAHRSVGRNADVALNACSLPEVLAEQVRSSATLLAMMAAGETRLERTVVAQVARNLGVAARSIEGMTPGGAA